MKKYFNYFIYVSLIFLIVALVRADYLSIPAMYSPWLIMLSIPVLFAGFVLEALSWKKALEMYGHGSVSLRDSIASLGLSIFGKYIPGKIWVILGRSAYIAKKYDIDEKDTVTVSLNTQFITLWIALLLGSLSLIFVKMQAVWIILSALAWVILSVILFFPFANTLMSWLISKIIKKKYTIPQLSLGMVLRVSPWFLAVWITWCLAFYLFTQGLSPQPITPAVMLIFPFAATLGILAIVVPGGVGVREGVLAAMLMWIGLDNALAVTIAATSRLWFLSGECFVFLLALVCRSLGKKTT
ncbi:MAG TPA: lysylphosphatidylglycerol synthase domain-containing protein [Bacteroidales bacterium]|nr:lysylphosphatidylglycerol synthase domain-containing protein [Bacteroidales bacterium]